MTECVTRPGARARGSAIFHLLGHLHHGAGAQSDRGGTPELRVHGLKALRVADDSIMPTVVSGNTNAACIMIGDKCAEMMLAGR
jgi:choline dehydrogenase